MTARAVTARTTLSRIRNRATDPGGRSTATWTDASNPQGAHRRHGWHPLRTALFTVLASTSVCAGCTSHRSARAEQRQTKFPLEHAIARAHRVDPVLFAIFPRHVGARYCLIPRGGFQSRMRGIRGFCRTRAHAPGHRSDLTLVSFTETWPIDCRPGGRRSCHSHTWQLSISRTGEVTAQRNLGATAPQFYY